MARPAGTKLAVASRHGITPPTLTRWSRTLTQAGLRLPLTPELAGKSSRRTRPGEDQTSRGSGLRGRWDSSLRPRWPPAVHRRWMRGL